MANESSIEQVLDDNIKLCDKKHCYTLFTKRYLDLRSFI